MCRFALLGCPVPNCGYAHSADELTPIMCKHGSRCMFDRRRPNLSADKRPCGMFHPDEDTSSDALYKRAVEFAKPYDPKELVFKSSICQFSQCPKGSECTYAHSEEEIQIPLCVFGKFCPGYGKCRYEHNRHLTKKEYFEKRRRTQKILSPEKMAGLFVIKVDQPKVEYVEIEDPTITEDTVELIEVIDEDDEDEDAKLATLSLTAYMRLFEDVKPRTKFVKVEAKPVEEVKEEAKPVGPNANLSDEKIALGQLLYPLIAVTFPKYAGQITGMILELDTAEIEQLLQDQSALNQRMIEGMSMLVGKE